MMYAGPRQLPEAFEELCFEQTPSQASEKCEEKVSTKGPQINEVLPEHRAGLGGSRPAG